MTSTHFWQFLHWNLSKFIGKEPLGGWGFKFIVRDLEALSLRIVLIFQIKHYLWLNVKYSDKKFFINLEIFSFTRQHKIINYSLPHRSVFAEALLENIHSSSIVKILVMKQNCFDCLFKKKTINHDIDIL